MMMIRMMASMVMIMTITMMITMTVLMVTVMMIMLTMMVLMVMMIIIMIMVMALMLMMMTTMDTNVCKTLHEILSKKNHSKRTAAEVSLHVRTQRHPGSLTGYVYTA